MAWLTDEELVGAIEARLLDRGDGGLDPAGGWPAIAAAANVFAKNCVTAALVARGVDAADVEGWPRAREYQLDLGLWHAFVHGALGKDFDPTFIDKLDRRAELATVPLDDVLPEPASTGGAVRAGRLSTDRDLFGFSGRRKGW